MPNTPFGPIPNNAFNQAQMKQANDIFASVRQIVGPEAADKLSLTEARELYAMLPQDFNFNGESIPTNLQVPDSPSYIVRNWPDLLG